MMQNGVKGSPYFAIYGDSRCCAQERCVGERGAAAANIAPTAKQPIAHALPQTPFSENLQCESARSYQRSTRRARKVFHPWFDSKAAHQLTQRGPACPAVIGSALGRAAHEPHGLCARTGH